MMNKILTTIFSLLALALTSTSALAHSGHMANESVHGFLHIEHIIMLAVIGLAAYIISVTRDK